MLLTNICILVTNIISLFFQTPCWYDYTKRDHKFVGPNSYPIGVSPYPFSPTLGHPPVAVQWHRSATIDVFGGFTFKNEKLPVAIPYIIRKFAWCWDIISYLESIHKQCNWLVSFVSFTWLVCAMMNQSDCRTNCLNPIWTGSYLAWGMMNHEFINWFVWRSGIPKY